MIGTDQDKKLVKQYKKTNKILKKQLQSLNEQIDKLILQKSNRIGLQKLPMVQKQITDNKVITVQVQNLKKRLQQLVYDNKQYKEKASIDYIKKIKDLQQILKQKFSQKDEIKKKIKIYEKKLTQEKSEVNLRKQEDKLLQKIQAINNQLNLAKKIEKDLNQSINIQNNISQKKQILLTDLQKHKKQLINNLDKTKKMDNDLKKEVKIQKSIQEPKPKIDDESWIQLKKQFLQLKQKNQNEQMFLFQQNDRLRKQIKYLQQQLKIKKGRVQVVKKYSSNQNEKALYRINRNTIQIGQKDRQKIATGRKKNYLTLDNDKGYRYRGRNNSINYKS